MKVMHCNFSNLGYISLTDSFVYIHILHLLTWENNTTIISFKTNYQQTEILNEHQNIEIII